MRTLATLFLLFASLANAAELSVPATVQEHSLVRIALKDCEPKNPADVLVMTVAQGEIQFVEPVATSQKCEWVFTGPPGSYAIRVSYTSAEDGTCALTARVKIVKAGPPGPEPTPNPNPNPNPTPTPPGPVDEKYGYDAVLTPAMPTDAPARAKAEEVANNFEVIASAAVAGTLRAEQMGPALKVKNTATLSTQALQTAWATWKDAWKKHTDALLSAGKINTVPEMAEAYLETAAVLRRRK